VENLSHMLKVLRRICVEGADGCLRGGRTRPNSNAGTPGLSWFAGLGRSAQFLTQASK
jgi:hypothetical protein